MFVQASTTKIMFAAALMAWLALTDTAYAQPVPQLRTQQHFLNDFDLAAIGLVLVFVMAVLTVRKLWGKQK